MGFLFKVDAPLFFCHYVNQKGEKSPRVGQQRSNLKQKLKVVSERGTLK